MPSAPKGERREPEARRGHGEGNGRGHQAAREGARGWAARLLAIRIGIAIVTVAGWIVGTLAWLNPKPPP